MIALAKVRGPAKAAAAAGRVRGGRGRVEAFFAFDDPNSAVALVELDRRLVGRSVDLVPFPVLERDMEGDPAVEAKRAYAVVDASRIAARSGRSLSRTEPLLPGDTAFLAEWVAAAKPAPAVKDFTVAALRSLWLEGNGPIDREALAASWRLTVGGEPPAGGAEAVRANEKRMKRRGAYAVPMAWVHGRLFFAHDRLDQICDELDLLGWRAR